MNIIQVLQSGGSTPDCSMWRMALKLPAPHHTSSYSVRSGPQVGLKVDSFFKDNPKGCFLKMNPTRCSEGSPPLRIPSRDIYIYIYTHIHIRTSRLRRT